MISGTFRIGMGEKADEGDAGRKLHCACARHPAHFVSVDEETVVQLNNIRPWVITYIDPKEEPRRKPKQPSQCARAPVTPYPMGRAGSPSQ